MIILGFIAIALLSVMVCIMWAYTAIQVEKERKSNMNKAKFWLTEMKKNQKCNVCGKEIKEGRVALVFTNTKSENIKSLSRVRICMECAIELSTLLEKGKVI